MNTSQGTFQLPPAMSSFAEEIDSLYYFVYWISVVTFVLIVGTMLWFVVRYNRKKGHRPQVTGHHRFLEWFWTFSPLILLIGLFHWGFKAYLKGSIAPENATVIRTRGMQWNWEFEHPNGMTQINELTVPEKTPIRMVMSSSDVLHSFYIPAFRTKKDVVPGMYTTLWFEAKEKGDVQVFCTEYCGAPPGAEGNAGHSNMLAMIHVVSKGEYEKFLAEGPPIPSGLTPAQWGAQLYTQNGCKTCHNVDGVTKQPAPNFKGLYGREERFTDGSSIKVDENYIRESILKPQAKIVSGYENVLMPPYRLPDRQIDALIAYMKSLNP